MNCPELGPIAKDSREHSGKKIKDWASEHGVGTTIVSEFERLGKIPQTGRIRRALERAYGFPDRSLDRIAAGESPDSVLTSQAMDHAHGDRLPELVRQLQVLVEELARTIDPR